MNPAMSWFSYRCVLLCVGADKDWCCYELVRLRVDAAMDWCCRGLVLLWTGVGWGHGLVWRSMGATMDWCSPRWMLPWFGAATGGSAADKCRHGSVLPWIGAAMVWRRRGHGLLQLPMDLCASATGGFMEWCWHGLVLLWSDADVTMVWCSYGWFHGLELPLNGAGIDWCWLCPRTGATTEGCCQ